jgi:drug/metabolite transporter (DMT)-like permease
MRHYGGFRLSQRGHVLPESHSQRTLAFAALVIAMAIWGSTFVVTKAAMREFSPFLLAFLRFAIASLCLLLALRGWRRVAALRHSVSLGQIAFLAVVGVAAFTVAFNYALVYGSASQGALIYAAIPAVVAICGALFLKERLQRSGRLGIALSIVGAVVIALGAPERAESAPAPLLGALLMLLSVVLWGGYTVVAKRVAHADQLALTFAVSALGALALLPAIPIEYAVRGFTATSALGWLGVLYLGVLASAVCYALYNFALSSLDASTVGVYTNIDPVVGVACAFVFLGETLAPAQIVGALVVFAGIWLASSDGTTS